MFSITIKKVKVLLDKLYKMLIYNKEYFKNRDLI